MGVPLFWFNCISLKSSGCGTKRNWNNLKYLIKTFLREYLFCLFDIFDWLIEYN